MIVLLATAAPPIQAQTEWNDRSVLRLVERAREARASTATNPEMESYSGEATGHVYFYVERPDTNVSVLVRGDQVALELYWQAPDQTRQWIVGRRFEKRLPTEVQYHLDHLTVVQDDYGDFIRLGDGDEVNEVTHPIGPGGQATYDYRLSDSLTIAHSGGEVRVWEISVRPKDLDRPGVIGAVFIDRDRAAIVRMNLSFTPSSYVDSFIDYIRISLDNSLWLGEHWLPWRQEIEIRREMPYLDFSAGSVIRTSFRIRGYEFNVPLLAGRMAVPSVGIERLERREAYPFEEGVFAPLEAQGGLGPTPSLEDVRHQVREVAEGQVLSGLSPLRVHAANFSDVWRHNRAEGTYVGAGATLRPFAGTSVRLKGGYAFGRSRGSGRAVISGERPPRGFWPTLDVYWDQVTDIGPALGATGLENSLSSSLDGVDYYDPYFRRGATLTMQTRGAGGLKIAGTYEKIIEAIHTNPEGDSATFRPIRSVEPGNAIGLSATTALSLPGGGTSAFTLAGTHLGGRTYGRALADAEWQIDDPEERWKTTTTLQLGAVTSNAPPQALFLLGGRYTIPGHEYRLFTGDAFALARAEVTIPIVAPWVGIRAFGVAGATFLESVTPPDDWSARTTGGIRGSVGLGLSLGWDALRLDLAKAVRGSGWEFISSVSPRLGTWM